MRWEFIALRRSLVMRQLLNQCAGHIMPTLMELGGNVRFDACGLRMINGEDSRMKLLARLAIGVGTMVGSAALTVPSALAGPPTPHCGSNIVCWYGHRDFQGDTSSSNPQTPRECVDLSRFGPVAESVANASDFPQHF